MSNLGPAGSAGCHPLTTSCHLSCRMQSRCHFTPTDAALCPGSPYQLPILPWCRARRLQWHRALWSWHGYSKLLRGLCDRCLLSHSCTIMAACVIRRFRFECALRSICSEGTKNILLAHTTCSPLNIPLARLTAKHSKCGSTVLLILTAVDRFIWMAYKPNNTNRVRIVSHNFLEDGLVDFELGKVSRWRTGCTDGDGDSYACAYLCPCPCLSLARPNTLTPGMCIQIPAPQSPETAATWARFAYGVDYILAKNGYDVKKGMDAVRCHPPHAVSLGIPVSLSLCQSYPLVPSLADMHGRLTHTL